MRVLVADDHSLFRDGLVSLLEAAGHQVVGQVGDGQAAVEAARRLDPELILLDVSMPNLDGLAALRQIKAERPHAKVVNPELILLDVSMPNLDGLAALRQIKAQP